jgi:serine protein kinase
MSILDRLQAYQQAEQALAWTGTLDEYLEIVRATPTVADLAHARLMHMVGQAGSTRRGDRTHWPFFDPVLVGVDPQIQAIMKYFDGAARGLDVRKRVLLLIGPPGAGKSSLLVHLKRALEAYSRTPAGAVYAIAGCPMQEEPLHLIPAAFRDEVAQELGVVIEGDLCPVCQLRYDREGVEQFRVERVLLSEKNRRGIGTFVPGSEKDMSIDQLVGSLDFSKITVYGSEADPRAYQFNGELNVASRGIMEMQEALKASNEMLYTLLGLAQERAIKTPRFALIYADEVVLAHANLNEYRKFIADKGNEAIANRMYVVHMPYVLRVDDETTIYQRMLAETDAMRGIHVAPHTLESGALFSVLSRLTKPKDEKLTLWTKAQLYNGATIGEYTDQNVRELHAEDPHEGLTGLSPRDAMNVLTHAMGQTEVPCVTPIDLLKSLKQFIETERFLSATEGKAKEGLHQFRVWVRETFDKAVREDVQTAFVHAFDDGAQTLFENYLTHAEAWDSKDQVPDPITGEPHDPDVTFLRQIEERIQVSEGAAAAFRAEILKKQGAILRRGEAFRWDSHPRLKAAISQKLFDDSKSVMVSTLSTKTPDPKQRARLAEVVERLQEKGYCVHCAEAALHYVGFLMRQ